MRYAAVCLRKQYETTEALYHHFALPMFNTRRNRRIHISYKSWTQYTRFVVKVQSHESSRQTDTCHCHTTSRRMPERTSSNASTFSADRRDRISVTVRPIPTKSHARIGPQLADTVGARPAVVRSLSCPPINLSDLAAAMLWTDELIHTLMTLILQLNALMQ